MEDDLAPTGGSTFQRPGLGSDVMVDGTSVFGRGSDGNVLSDRLSLRQHLLLSDQHGGVTGSFDPPADIGPARQNGLPRIAAGRCSATVL